MYHEEVAIQRGETVPNLVAAYGHKATEAKRIWESSENAVLAALRGTPDKVQPGDVLMVPIPWRWVHQSLTARAATAALAAGGTLILRRNGMHGTRLSFVQTVNRDNQPTGPNPNRFCVDGCTPDDVKPFYFTDAELTARPDRSVEFSDQSGRNPPAAGITRWRAVVSIAVVTRWRVTVYGSQVWGWNMDTAGTVTVLGPRDATAWEVHGHLNLLRHGVGTAAGNFTRLGWTFREPPVRPVGDFPVPRTETRYA